MADVELVMYSRRRGCPFVAIAERVLQKHQVPYRELFIDDDAEARQRVRAWTGFDSVPTLILAQPGETHPHQAPAPLAAGHSPRGVDRGSMITEASAAQLEDWLRRHELI